MVLALSKVPSVPLEDFLRLGVVLRALEARFRFVDVWSECLVGFVAVPEIGGELHPDGRKVWVSSPSGVLMVENPSWELEETFPSVPVFFSPKLAEIVGRDVGSPARRADPTNAGVSFSSGCKVWGKFSSGVLVVSNPSWTPRGSFPSDPVFFSPISAEISLFDGGGPA